MDIREWVCDSILDFERDCNEFELSWAIDYLQKIRDNEFKKVK